MAKRRDYQYNIVKDNKKPSSVTVFYKGEDYVATPAHPNFNLILEAIERGDKANVVVGLFDTYQSIGQRFKALVKKVFTGTPSGMSPSPDRPSERGRRERLRRISEKVSVRDQTVYYDGHPVHGVLADTIAKFVIEGNRDFEGLALFLEKLMLNPNPHSREQLYEWLKHMSFVITDDGNFIGYKYLGHDMKSEHSGVGIVNGKRVNGRLDNSIGNVVEMPRKMVEHNPSKACSHGLHVGTWGFVSGRATIVRVEVDPRDVVSVPTDCSGQKLRVCKYKVLERAHNRTDSKIYAGATI